MADKFPYQYIVTIVDNGSTDATPAIAAQIAADHKDVAVVTEPEPGRGRALKKAWGQSTCDILMYMDEDLSTDLSHLPQLIEPLVSGDAALAIGTRRSAASQVHRCLKREILSRGYVWLDRMALGLRVSDLQCGFKAIRRDAATKLLPQCHDNSWFFDTELIAKCASRGWNIVEIPVKWTEDADSRVRLWKTMAEDVVALDRLRRESGRRASLDTVIVSALMVAAAALYLTDIQVNHYANSFYAAAVQAATVNWKAFFYGSLDAANFITVDKPPASLWLMALSTRLFGFASFTMLLPDALAGVATVGLVYACVRRVFGTREAFIAGLVMLLSPVAALMFRYNNPDAVMTFFMTASAYTFIRAMENRHPLRWLAATGILLGLAFDTKMLEGLIVLPIMAVLYLALARPNWVKRLQQLLIAGVVTVVAVGWWPTIVWLVPAADRPYIDSTTDNNIWNLIFGYNGLGRIFGEKLGGGAIHAGTRTPSVAALGSRAADVAGGRGGLGGFGAGSAGLFRLFNADFGPNIAWLLVPALISAGFIIWLTRRLPRTDRRRMMALLWGGWLLLTGIIFSSMTGIVHSYYAVAMTPAIAVLVGIGVPLLWQAYRTRTLSAWLLPLTVAATTLTAYVTLRDSASWLPWLQWVILLAGTLCAIWLAAGLIVKSGLAPNGPSPQQS